MDERCGHRIGHGIAHARSCGHLRLAPRCQSGVLSASAARAAASQTCGFDSIATFYRVFRSTFGITPGDVRMASLNA
ncbi:MAG: AraC family transcriptional regulator [Afipia sp.]|nr:AraC family transcriptional regulator [Afipia sp.]